MAIARNRRRLNLRDLGQNIREFYERKKSVIKAGVVTSAIGALALTTALSTVDKAHREKARQRIESYEAAKVRQPAEWVQLEYRKWWQVGRPKWQKKVAVLPPKTKNVIVAIGRSAFDKRNSEPLMFDELKRTVETIYMNVSEDEKRTETRIREIGNRLENPVSEADEQRVMRVGLIVGHFDNYFRKAQGAEREAITDFLR